MRYVINFIMKKLFHVNDSVNDAIIAHFKELRKKYVGIDYFVDTQKDAIVFSFPMTTPVIDIVFPLLHLRKIELLSLLFLW